MTETKPCRQCSECSGCHHWIDANLHKFDADAEEPWAIAMRQVHAKQHPQCADDEVVFYWTCKHCDAWRVTDPAEDTEDFHWLMTDTGLLASSRVFEDVSYRIFPSGFDWEAFIDGSSIASGTLEECVAACHECEETA